jgi:aldehyde dehydrogenase (NAD+)
MDLRKPLMGSQNCEISGVISDIEDAVANLAAWMEPKHIEPSPQFAGNETMIQYEPRGGGLVAGAMELPVRFGLRAAGADHRGRQPSSGLSQGRL